MRAQWFSTRDRLVLDLSSLTLVADSNDVFFSYISGYLVVFITQQIHDYIDYIPGKCFSKTYQVCNRCATVTFTKTCLQVFTLRLLVDAPALYVLSTLAHTSFLQRFTVSICSNNCYSPGWFRRHCLVDDTAERPLAAQTALDLGGAKVTLLDSFCFGRCGNISWKLGRRDANFHNLKRQLQQLVQAYRESIFVQCSFFLLKPTYPGIPCCRQATHS